MEENKRPLSEILRNPIQLIVVLWLVHVAQFFFNLDDWGIYPRALDGLQGIFLGPLVHANLGHLFNNSVPLFVLTCIISYFYPRVALRTFAMIYVCTGILVWLFANGGAYHVGISGVVYGLVSFVFFTGIFRKSVQSIILSLLTLSLYSGMFEGILPGQPHISWESHLFGAIVGIFVAFYYRTELEEQEELELENKKPSATIPYAQRPFFFAQDTFEMTREARWQKQLEADEAQRRMAEEQQQQEYLRLMQLQIQQQAQEQAQQKTNNSGNTWNQNNTWS